MSCQNIETMITELARGQMLEARAKEEALAHMEACKRCASRFADEQSLSSGLGAVAASVAATETPARVEAALLAAFRQGAAFSHPIARPKSRPRWVTWCIAAAAAVLIVFALAIPQLLSSGSPEISVERAADRQPIRGLSSEHDDPIPQAANAVENEIATVGAVRQKTGASRRRPTIHPAALSNRSDSRSTVDSVNTRSEIVTDFLPLTYASNLSQLNDGQVVRVQLPRAALQSFGLPMNAERASERVTADVLLGYDGVARAIRFVR